MINIEERLKENGIKIINYMDKDLAYIYDEKEDKYFSCIDDMEDHYDNRELEMPKYAYGTYFEPIRLYADDILESACEEHVEDMISMLNGVSELEEAIKKFNDDNESIGSYYPDEKTIVELFIK